MLARRVSSLRADAWAPSRRKLHNRRSVAVGCLREYGGVTDASSGRDVVAVLLRIL